MDQVKWATKICSGGFGFWHTFLFLYHTRLKWVTSPDHLCGPRFSLILSIHFPHLFFLTFQCLKLWSICICWIWGMPILGRLIFWGHSLGLQKWGLLVLHFLFGTEWVLSDSTVQSSTLIKAGPPCIRHALWYRMLPHSGVEHPILWVSNINLILPQ